MVSSSAAYGGQELVMPFYIVKQSGVKGDGFGVLEEQAAFLRAEGVSLLESIPCNFPTGREYGTNTVR